MNCEVCKKVFSGIECLKQHLASDKHRKKMQLHSSMSSILPAIPSSNSITGDQNAIQCDFPCTICAVAFQTFSEYNKHAMSDDHARMVLVKNNAEAAHMENWADLSNSSIDSTTRDSVFNNSSAAVWQSCKTCDKTFSGPEPYQQHIDSMAHKKKCGLLPVEGFPVEESLPNTFPFYCSACNIVCSGHEPFAEHKRSIRHQKKVLTASNGLTANSTSKAMEVFKCEFCDRVFTGQFCYEEHLKSDAHRRVIDLHCHLKKMSGKENKSAVSGPDPEHSEKPNGLVNPLMFHCSLCDVWCSGHEQYQSHMVGKNHKRKQMRADACSKQEELKNLFESQTTSLNSLGQCSSKEGQTEVDGNNYGNVSGYAEIDGSGRNGNVASGGVGQDIKSYLYGDEHNAKTCVPSDLDLTFFAVGEEIDFDKDSKSKIEAKELDKVEIKEEVDEEMEE